MSDIKTGDKFLIEVEVGALSEKGPALSEDGTWCNIVIKDRSPGGESTLSVNVEQLIAPT